jgi:hypothetical protein
MKLATRKAACIWLGGVIKELPTRFLSRFTIDFLITGLKEQASLKVKVILGKFFPEMSQVVYHAKDGRTITFKTLSTFLKIDGTCFSKSH